MWWCSLAGSFIARIDRRTGESIVVEPPTRDQGARRVWSDSRGRIWVSEWNSGQLSMHDPATKAWRAWKLPGDAPRAYAVYVDERDQVWVSDFGANVTWQFDPAGERFTRHAMPRDNANVRQILGRAGLDNGKDVETSENETHATKLGHRAHCLGHRAPRGQHLLASCL